MKKILLVDDEPYIVDGLYFSLLEHSVNGFTLYKAYSAEEALQRLMNTRIDIVISDIRMPGMNGLELQQWILDRWPKCKVIFLTGYGDIQYAQQAIRLGCSDYILKTEGDEAILQSIRKAIKEINENDFSEQVMLQAKEQVLQALPVLRKEWFLELLDETRLTTNLQDSKLQELKMNLSLKEPVFIIGGRVDRWEEQNFSHQLLMMYAIQNIVEELLNRVEIQTILLESSEVVWLIQSSINDKGVMNELGTNIDSWQDTLSYISCSLESIQTTCMTLLNLPVSFVCSGVPVVWEEMGVAYKKIKQTMILGIGNGEQMIISNCVEEPVSKDSDKYRRYLIQFEQYLESNEKEACEKILIELFDLLPSNYHVFAEIYLRITVLFLEQFNKLGREIDETTKQKIEQLMNISSHKSKKDILDVLNVVLEGIFQQRKSIQDQRSHRIIRKLNQYIRDNLATDLSLDTLGHLVYMNPSYLSTLYKQYTGKNVSDYITDLRVSKAKDLLLHSTMKIHEIGEVVGFSTAGYFTRFFKKHVGVTPQEFRN